MRAARYHGAGDVRIEEVNARSLGVEDVRVAIDYCGICGTDLHEYTVGPAAIPTEPHPGTGERLPVTMGHEFSGRVTETGEETDVEVETPVVVNPGIACEECWYCETGNYTLCNKRVNLGIHGGGGGFAESIVVPVDNVIPLSEDLDMRHATLAEPLAVALHGVRQAGPALGETAAVFGAGPIGLGVVQVLQIAGVSETFVSEPRDSRREAADALGATTIDPRETDTVRKIRGSGTGGADVTFETAGVESSLTAAVRSSRKAGTVCILSVFEEAVEFDPNLVMMAERKLIGSFAYDIGPLADSSEFADVVDMMRDGRFDPESLVTSVLPLSRITEGFERLLNPESEDIKVLVRPD